MSHAFQAEVISKANRRNRKWYQDNLLKVLQAAKDKQARNIDVSLTIAEELMRKYNEPMPKPIVVPLRELTPFEDDSLMKPIEPAVSDLLYKSTEKGASEKYLKVRYKKIPEDKFFFRICSNWDYGWQQKQSRIPAREVHCGRCAILRETFYRKNNLAPDPIHYAVPAGGEISICSEYSCHFD